MLYNIVIINLISSDYHPRKKYENKKQILSLPDCRWSLLGFEAQNALKQAGLKFILMLGRLLSG